MEGRGELCCDDCGRRDEISGEMPAEYASCFVDVAVKGGWVVKPGSRVALLCGECLKNYEGSETKDDAAKM